MTSLVQSLLDKLDHFVVRDTLRTQHETGAQRLSTTRLNTKYTIDILASQTINTIRRPAIERLIE